MKNSTQLTEEIAIEFSVSSADEVALRAKIHRLKKAIIDEFADEVKSRVIRLKPTQDISGINNKQADDYDNQSEETRQRG